jgi:hypothetical protein
MTKIDKRKNYIMVVDVETAGGRDNPLVYDIGYAITDKQGNIYETRSFIIEEIFYNKPLMSSAYYSEKIPKYLKDISEGTRTVVPFLEMRNDFIALAEKYNIKTLSAYNLMFDTRALTNTIRNITKEPRAKFLPRSLKNVKMMCIWCLACEVLYTQKTFAKVAIRNGWVSKAGNLKTTAEVGYRYLTGNIDFGEEHTGLEDVLIEIKIMAYALRQNKKRIGGVFAQPWKIPNQK